MRIILDHDTWVVRNRGREGLARPREYGSKQALKVEVLAPSKHQDSKGMFLRKCMKAIINYKLGVCPKSKP